MDLTEFTDQGKFLMLALDHRGSFKKLINPNNPESVSSDEATELKSLIINSVEDQFTSLLIDEEIGLPAYKSRKKPFLLPVERSGYEQTGSDRLTEIEYSVVKIKQLGASGVKLLIFFNPDGATKDKQIETSRDVLKQCRDENMPLFLEIRTYVGEREADKMEMAEREDIVLRSVKMFLEEDVRPDVFKLEYPGSSLGCQKITEILGQVPWILLTMGDSFDNFVKVLREATAQGCRGFLAGRALWQEVCQMQGVERQEFLDKTLPERFKIIADIAKGY